MKNARLPMLVAPRRPEHARAISGRLRHGAKHRAQAKKLGAVQPWRYRLQFPHPGRREITTPDALRRVLLGGAPSARVVEWMEVRLVDGMVLELLVDVPAGVRLSLDPKVKVLEQGPAPKARNDTSSRRAADHFNWRSA